MSRPAIDGFLGADTDTAWELRHACHTTTTLQHSFVMSPTLERMTKSLEARNTAAGVRGTGAEKGHAAGAAQRVGGVPARTVLSGDAGCADVQGQSH